MADESWSPMPYVHRGVWCHLCFRPIPRMRKDDNPGKSERTQAYYSSTGRVWECLSCHAARMEAQEKDLPLVVWGPAPVRRGAGRLPTTPATGASEASLDEPEKPSDWQSSPAASPMLFDPTA